MLLRLGSLVLMTVLLAACAGNTTYRGVSPQIWKQLTPEQKQLIVDKSYQQTMDAEPGQ